MKTVDKQVASTFGVIAGAMLLAGLAALAIAAAQAGSVQMIFARPQEELGTAIFGVVCCCLAAAYGLIALCFGSIHHRYVRRVEELSRFGVQARGKIIGIQVDWLVRMGRQRPVFARVECTLPDGKPAVLRSHRVWRTAIQDGMSVDVLMDPADPGRYAILFADNA